MLKELSLLNTRTDHISVCICTYKRPMMLTKSLNHLDNQITKNVFSYSIVVVDNDEHESAKDAVDNYSKTSKVAVAYYVESKQNIALARNKAVENAQGDYIAFIDDDEFPEENWLFNLYGTLKKYGVTGVLGPVKPYFESEPPKWITHGRFYEKGFLATGEILDWSNTRTSNALVKNIFSDNSYKFKQEYGSGGEDKDMFRRLMQNGHSFVWCAEALVYEIIPPARCDRAFILRRALLRGQVANKTTIGSREVCKSMIAVPIYSLLLPFILIAGQYKFMKYAEKNAEHIGRLLGLLHINLIKENYVMCTDIQ